MHSDLEKIFLESSSSFQHIFIFLF